MTYTDNFNYDKYDKMLSVDLADAAQNGDLAKVKSCFSKNTTPDIHYKDDIALLLACQNGHLDIIKFLLTDNTLKEHAYINGYLEGHEIPFTDSPLSLATLYNQFEAVKYLLTSNELSQKASLRIRNDLAFIAACQLPTTKLIDYFCFSNELTEHVDLKNNHTFFKDIFQFGTIENLDYVLDKNIVGFPTTETLQTCFEKIRFYETNTSEKLDYLFSLNGSEYIDIYHNNNEFFRRAIENKDLHALTYIIVNHDVKIYELTHLSDLLNEPKNEKVKDHIDKTLLYHTLHTKTFHKPMKENNKRKI